MVGLGGLEPPASPLSGVRSNHLSYRPRDRAPEPTPACLEANPKRLLLKSPAMDGRSFDFHGTDVVWNQKLALRKRDFA